MKYKDGEVYEGEWRAGKRAGNGKYVYKNQTVYEGEWQSTFLFQIYFTF